jgi:arabinose-5-phosphate isomerase
MSHIKDIAEKCLRDEAQALLDLIPQIADDFVNAVNTMYQCKGKVIVTGVGKSGHIGAKIAATLASTGTPSFFINPVDALHGDLGMITNGDVVLAVSNSGQTDELLRFIPYLHKRNIPLVGMSGNADSLLAQHSLYHIKVFVAKEACPLNLAPTSSTTAALAMGDAIACALINLRKFRETDYAMFHPGGNLGRRLLMRVKDIMYTKKLPLVTKENNVSEMLSIMTKGKLGLVVVLENNKVLGLLTNGDLRRAIENNRDNFFNLNIYDIMNPNPIFINEDESLTNADRIFKEKKLNLLLVLKSSNDFAGILDIREM